MLRTTFVAVLTAILAGAFAATALAHAGHIHQGPPGGLPPNNPHKGLIYDGLEPIKKDGPCAHAFKLKDSDRCTHGPDPAPEGIDISIGVLPTAVIFLPPVPKVQCDGDGVSGKRVQVIYAHASDVTDRYSDYLNSIRQWAADADLIYRNSAGETSGERHIRFVHNSACVPSVVNATLTPTGDDNFTNTQNDLKALGYDLTDRKYMVFVDANVYCGIGNVKNDDSSGAGNLNNGGPSYGRTDAGCWGGSVAAHELMHNIGGVQLSAPHSSGGWHCTDEYDRECYSDSPNYPALTYPCSDPAHDKIFDCNHDDYFHTNPAGGSYLDTHWNAADSEYLVAGAQPVWGYVWANDATAASYTPNTQYQRNSTGALNTIERTGTGAYTVHFTKLGIYYGGTVDVTAYGSGSENCKVGSWGPSLSDMRVYVRCFDAAGSPVDTQFAAAFTRPTSSSQFGYVWANNPSSASYTPNSWYQFNSSGASNTVTHSSTGLYQVKFPGIGGSGGTVKVTAYGYGNEYCKATSWSSFGSDVYVNVACQTPTGVLDDAYFTATWHASIGLLGTLTDSSSERGYVWADQQSAASYTPSTSYQYNSDGLTNTITRSATGTYQVTLPGLSTTRGHPEVTAYSPSGSTTRCKIQNWGWSGGDETVNVLCFDATGAAADSRYVLTFVD
ncbi:MAG TPA: hypothetical protein VGJ77_00570 [Gaiellaceae bacterium]|jgi:hypothetical protein